MRRPTVAIAIAAACVAPIDAQHCATSSSGVRRGYVAPHVAYVAPHVATVATVPIAVPVVVPAAVFQFLPAVGISVAAPAPVAAAPHGGHATGANLDAVVRASVAAVLAEQAAGRSGRPYAGYAAIPVAIGPAGSPAEARLPVGRATYAPPPSAYATPPSGGAANDAVSILSRRCASCHTGSASKGNIAIFDERGGLAALDRGQRSSIALAADLAMMPPSARGDVKSPAALPDAEILSLKKWAASR